MPRYAQLNQDYICVSDTQASGEIDKAAMIELTEDEPSPLGKVYDNGKWIERVIEE